LNKAEYELIKPYYTTKEISRYKFSSDNKYWIIYTRSDIKNKIHKYPNIKNHLDKFKRIITSDNKPYGLHRAREERFFKGTKIISLRKCSKPSFTLVDKDSYVSQTFYLIKTDRIDMKYLLGLLNSELITFWLRYMGKMQGDNFQVDKDPLLKIPIVQNISEDIKKEIIHNVDLIMNSKGNTDSYENKINKLIYELYELDDDDIQIIKNKHLVVV